MNPQRLSQMANQIARNFAAQGDAAAAEATARHIAAFWNPRMVAALREMDAAELDPVAARARVLLLDETAR